MNKTYKNIPARMKAEAFKQRVMSCFRAWEVNRLSSVESNMLTDDISR